MTTETEMKILLGGLGLFSSAMREEEGRDRNTNLGLSSSPKNRDFDDGDLVDEPVKSREKSSLSASLPLRFSPLLSDSLWFSSPLRYSPPLCFSSLLSISLHLYASLPVSASLIRLSDGD
ncbi:hypothetical protein YC2023_018897 [Brassica napus]